MEKNINLFEELKRIHSIAYGKEYLTEDFLNVLTQKNDLFKKDVPEKSDYLTGNPNEIFSSLESAIKNGGLSQQPTGSMQYQKNVESLQIALLLLGYDLPKHGVDGLYGPETQSAVQKYIATNNLEKSKNAAPHVLQNIINQLKSKNITSENIKKYIDPIISGGSDLFTDIDITTNDGFKKYEDISNRYLTTKQPNPLKINGNMLATGARQAFFKYHKYVPPELALGQLTIEGGIGNKNINSRPIRTKNPFNVGNVDVGKSAKYDNLQNAINDYYDLIARNYLGKGKNANLLLQQFTNKLGNRYASDMNYEKKLFSIVKEINKISKSTV